MDQELSPSRNQSRTMETEKPEPAPLPRRPWRRAAVATSVLGGMLFSVLAVLPLAVMNSAHRDSMLNSRLEQFGLTVATESGSGSWVTPIVLRNVTIQDETGSVRCVIRELRTSRTIMGLLMNGGDLGTISVIEPQVVVALDEDGNLPAGLFADLPPDDPNVAKPEFAVEILDASVKVSVPGRPLPFVDLSELDISASIANEENGRWLHVAPVQIFDHTQISESDTQQNLALIAPVLSQSTGLSGEVSAHFNQFDMQLGDDASGDIAFSGEATFHSVTARLKKDWVVQLSEMLGRTVGSAIPDRLEIVRDSAVRFSGDGQGIHHSGLAFLLPQIAGNMNIQSSGMVGFDETLDLALNLQLPQMASTNPFMRVLSQMTQLPFQLRVTGTVDAPQLETPEGSSILDQLSRNMKPEQASQEPPGVTNSVFELIDSAASPDPVERTSGVVGGVFDLIRSIQKNKENAPPRPPKQKRKKRKKKDRSGSEL